MFSCLRRLHPSILILPGILLLVSLPGCGRKPDVAPPQPLEVTVSKPLQRPLTDYAYFSGNVEASESVEIRARVEGYLEKMYFTPGARVKRGDVLFQIDPKPYQAKLNEARGDLVRRQAEQKNSEAALKRKEQALKTNAISEIEVIQARADFDVAKGNVQSAQAAVETAEINLSYTKVRSPISGRITRNMVDVGNLVGSTDRTLLATIVNDEPVFAYFNVSERELLQYKEGKDSSESLTRRDGKTRVFIGLAGRQDYPFEGRIDYMDNRLDRSTGTIQVRGIFDNAEQHLLPGMFARIRVPVGNRERALLVPDTALGTDQRGDYLLAVGDKNIVEYRQVKTGALVGDLRVIDSGISPEDRIIISGLQRARPGLTVNPTEAPSPGSPSTETQAAAK
ncbi:MAG: efflux RND transporter periplasmic adaptor subunit [Desulfobacteraceae bacterium]|nr:efflux RND transporter periplasmic adaptor subunit [Desulfobacteraceae bacterium]